MPQKKMLPLPACLRGPMPRLWQLYEFGRFHISYFHNLTWSPWSSVFTQAQHPFQPVLTFSQLWMLPSLPGTLMRVCSRFCFMLVFPSKDSRSLCHQSQSGVGISFLFQLLIFFWPRHVGRGILVPQPGIEPEPPALEVRSLNHWTAREVLIF